MSAYSPLIGLASLIQLPISIVSIAISPAEYPTSICLAGRLTPFEPYNQAYPVDVMETYIMVNTSGSNTTSEVNDNYPIYCAMESDSCIVNLNDDWIIFSQIYGDLQCDQKNLMSCTIWRQDESHSYKLQLTSGKCNSYDRISISPISLILALYNHTCNHFLCDKLYLQ